MITRSIYPTNRAAAIPSHIEPCMRRETARLIDLDRQYVPVLVAFPEYRLLQSAGFSLGDMNWDAGDKLQLLLDFIRRTSLANPAGGYIPCSHRIVEQIAYLAYWHFVLRGVGLYRSYRLAAAKRELRDLATATAIGAIPLVFMAPVFRFEYVTPQFVALFAVFTLIGLGLARRTLRAVGRRLRLYGRNLRNVVVIGVGDATIELSAQLARRTRRRRSLT